MVKLIARFMGLLGLLLLGALFKAQAQNVGIGTASPTQTLDVNGTVRVRGLTGTGTRLLQTDNSGNLSAAATAYPASATLTPTLASTATGLNNPLVAVSGPLAVVLNRGANTLSLYDVSSPSAVVLRGTYSGSGISSGTSLAMSGTTAAVLNNNSSTGYPVSVFTLGAGAPVLATTITPPAATSGSYAGLAMVGTILYVTYDHSGGQKGYFYVYDLSAPASPVLSNAAANSTSGFFTPTAIAAAGNLVCVSSPYGATTASDHFNVIDVSNPALPVVVGTNGGNGTGNFTYKARPLAMAGAVLCGLQPENNLLSTYDLSTPAAPTLRHTFTTGTTPVSVAMSGGLAYVACQGSNTLQVIDISGATATLRGSATLDATPASVAATSTLALAANGSAANDLQVFNAAFTRTVTVAPDGSVSSAPAPSGTDFIQNQTATTQAGGFNIGGSAVVGGTLAVGVLNNFAGGASAAPLALSSKVASYLSLKPTTAGTDDYFQLPAASTCMGRLYYLCNVGSVTANITSAGGGLVRASTGAAGSPFAMPTGSLGRTVIAISDGVNWTIGTIN